MLLLGLSIDPPINSFDGDIDFSVQHYYDNLFITYEPHFYKFNIRFNYPVMIGTYSFFRGNLLLARMKEY